MKWIKNKESSCTGFVTKLSSTRLLLSEVIWKSPYITQKYLADTGKKIENLKTVEFFNGKQLIDAIMEHEKFGARLQSREHCAALMSYIMSLGTFFHVEKEFKTEKTEKKKDKKKFRLLFRSNFKERPQTFEGIFYGNESRKFYFRFCWDILYVEFWASWYFLTAQCICFYYACNFDDSLSDFATTGTIRLGLKFLIKNKDNKGSP